MVTRRDMISLAAAGLAGTALDSQGAITRSALALRGAMMGGAKEGVVCPYVTDGLVAWWDGLNIGNGEWLDLIGGKKIIFSSTTATVGDNYIQTTLGSILTAQTELTGNTIQLEFCGRFVTVSNPRAAQIRVGLFGIGSVDGGLNPRLLGLRPDASLPQGRHLYSSASFNRSVVNSFSVPFNGVTNVHPYINGTTMNFNQYATTETNIYNAGQVVIGEDGKSVSVSSIRLYSRNLNAEEVSFNYAVDAARFNI